MLHWREQGRIVKKQYLVYRTQKLTKEELAQVDQNWLTENGIEVDVEKALAAVAARVQATTDVSLPYHHLVLVQYDHPKNSLPGSPNIFPNRRKTDAENLQLPVINVACLTPEPQRIELQFTPRPNYTITEPTTAEDSPTHIRITGTLDANGFTRKKFPRNTVTIRNLILRMNRA